MKNQGQKERNDKKMKDYKKFAFGVIAGFIILGLIYTIITINSSFPFFILFIGWFVILISVISRMQREEERRKIMNGIDQNENS